VAIVWAAASTLAAAHATTTQNERDAPPPLNQSAGARNGVTLLFDSRILGEIVLITGEGAVPRVPKAALIDMLLPVLDGDRAALSRLERLPDKDGLVTLAALQKAGFSVGHDRRQLRLARAPIAPPVSPSVATYDVAFASGGRPLGEMTVRYSQKTVLLPKAALIDMLLPALGNNNVAMSRLEALPETDGHVTLNALEAAGFMVGVRQNRFDVRFRKGVVAAQGGAAPVERPAAPAMPAVAEARAEVVAPIGPEGKSLRLKQDGEPLGEILVRAGADKEVLIPKAPLLDMITPGLEKDPAAVARIEELPDRDGHITLEDLRKTGLAVRVTQYWIEIGADNGEGEAGGGKFAKAISSRLNPTDRTITVSVPLKDGETQLGEIPVSIEPDGTVLVPKASLVQQLTPVLDKAALSQLSAVPESKGLVRLGDLGGARFRLAYDPNQLELAFSPAVDQRVLTELSVARARRSNAARLARPAIFSGYVNITTGADHRWDEGGPTSLNVGRPQSTSFYFDFRSAVSLAGVVIENDASIEGEIDPQQCPSGARCVYQHQSGFKRRRSALVWDYPEELLRMQLGDVAQPSSAFQRSTDVLGLSIEKAPRKLAPGENFAPVGGGSFSLERPAEVEILINGAITQRVRLNPGNYNIRDLPLTAGANDVELIITDDRGQRRTVAFSTFSDSNMLASGKSEWSINGGLASYFRDGERAYRPGDYLAGGFYRYGIADWLTLEAQAKGDMQVAEGGAGALMATPLGLWGLYGAASNSDTGLGVALNAQWDLINISGLFGAFRPERESLRLAAEFRTTQFRSPGEYVTTATGVLYPQTPYWLRVSAAYSLPIAWGATASLSARYQFADTQQIFLSPLTVTGDRYGADVTISSSLGRALSASITAGVSNETYRLSDVALGIKDDAPELRVMMRLFARPEARSHVSASYDSLNRASNVAGFTTSGSGVDRWEADANLQHNANEQMSRAAAALTYEGNRGEMRVSHSSSFEGDEGRQYSFLSQEQRSSVRFATAIAFADNQFAIGQPIRGGAFAIVHPHESLADKEVIVGANGETRARANSWGAALVSDLSPYARTTLPVDVEDLPIGYSLGTGTFDLFARYGSGYALEVGSANSVSAYGTLWLADFTPVSLTTGVAYPIENPLQQVVVFTNEAGRFNADGLAPGKWIIEMATDGAPTKFEIEIPKGTEGLYEAGLLKPVGAL
jgi:outer membrane usher protein